MKVNKDALKKRVLNKPRRPGRGRANAVCARTVGTRLRQFIDILPGTINRHVSHSRVCSSLLYLRIFVCAAAPQIRTS